MTSGLSPNAIALNDASTLGNYNNLSALQSLKYSSDEEARIDAVSKQFESMFVSMMLKSMRDANKAFGEDNPLNSSQHQFYQDMYDSQLAVSLSTGKGIGIAEVIREQLLSRLDKSGSTAVAGRDGFELDEATGKASGYRMDDYQRRAFPRHSAQAVAETMKEVETQLVTRAPKVTEPANLSTAVTDIQPQQIRGPEQFIDALYPLAKQVEQETGIDAKLMLAQSALETGWGRQQIVTDAGLPSYNLFGIKAHRDWQGEQADILTTEYRDGIAMKERASFRVYDSYQESFRDYAHFLQSHERYQDALALKDQPVQFAHALQASGYATDPQYGSKIERIMGQYFYGSNASEPISQDKRAGE